MSFNSKHVLGLRTMEIFTLSEYLVVSSRTGKVFRVLQPGGFSVGTNYLKTQVLLTHLAARDPHTDVVPLHLPFDHQPSHCFRILDNS